MTLSLRDPGLVDAVSALDVADREFIAWLLYYMENLALLSEEDTYFFLVPALDEMQRTLEKLRALSLPDAGRVLRAELAGFIQAVTASVLRSDHPAGRAA